MNGPTPTTTHHQLINTIGLLGHQSTGLLGNQPITTSSNLVNPATNDAPLEFNMNKNKAPMAMSDTDERVRGSRERRSGNHTNSPGNSGNLSALGTQQQGAAPNVWATGGMMGMGYPAAAMMGMMPMPDATLMGMTQSINQTNDNDECNSQWSMQYGMMGGMIPPDASMIQGHTLGTNTTRMPLVKEIIHCKSCTLFPPNPNCPIPTTRERPPGCRTVFVGGLPENITEEIIREVFERCGEITTIRVSKKNFCHIRFEHEEYVDAAIFLSGYRIRLGSHTDPPNTGRLHVDYAQARDDLYEWECRQRQLQREQRHRERLEQERMRPPSPPPVVHYTEHEAQIISDKIKGEETFTKAVQVVITWLERGDCSKRNANQFYSMIQSSNSHVRRLMSEKVQYEDEMARAKEMMKQRMHGLLIQFGQIERVFTAASHQKVWDHFTKAQRKNISMWKKQASEIRSAQLEETNNERADEEMDVSDSDNESDTGNCSRKKARLDDDKTNQNNNILNLKEENDSLRCQLEAYKNEIDLIRVDTKTEADQKEAQFKLLQQTLHNAQQQLLDTSRKLIERENAIKELENTISCNNTSPDKFKDEITDKLSDSDKIDSGNSPNVTTSVPSIDYILTEKDARLIGLVSTFLHVHPFGAGLDYVWSYLQKVEPTLRPSEVEALMSRFPNVFRHELSGIGANMERKWIFVGFDTPNKK